MHPTIRRVVETSTFRATVVPNHFLPITGLRDRMTGWYAIARKPNGMWEACTVPGLWYDITSDRLSVTIHPLGEAEGIYVNRDIITLDGKAITATNLWDTYPHPGKFEGEPLATILAYEASLDGCGELVGGEHGETSYEAVDCGGEADIPNLYAILTHHSNGFVTADWYETAAPRDEAFTAIAEDSEPIAELLASEDATLDDALEASDPFLGGSK